MTLIHIYLLVSAAWFLVGFKLIVTRAEGYGFDDAYTAHYLVLDLPPEYSNSVSWILSVKDPLTIIWFVVWFISLPVIRVPTLLALLSHRSHVKYREVKTLSKTNKWFMFNCHYYSPPKFL